jgi:hypothetical protein
VSEQKDSEKINMEDLTKLPHLNLNKFPPAPSPSEPIPPHPASPATEQTTIQENKTKNFLAIYASIGAAIVFLVVALSALCFFYYCHRKTSIVVPLSATTSSRHLQTTTMEGWLM